MLVFALIHNWSDSKKFKHLAIYSIIGVPVFVILHNLFESMTGSPSTSKFLNDLFSTLSVGSFILAVIICPITLIVGVWGWVTKK